jgi:hypothetical protein
LYKNNLSIQICLRIPEENCHPPQPTTWTWSTFITACQHVVKQKLTRSDGRLKSSELKLQKRVRFLSFWFVLCVVQEQHPATGFSSVFDISKGYIGSLPKPIKFSVFLITIVIFYYLFFNY